MENHNIVAQELQPNNVVQFLYCCNMQFGEWLRHHRKSLRLTQRDLAERTGISFSYISTLEREQPHSITGKSIQPKRDIVESLARAVNGNIEEALHAAGYATTSPTKPQTLSELITALEALGLEMPLMYDDLPDDPEAFRETIERIYLDIKLVIERTLTRSQERRLNEIQNKLANPPTRKLDTVELIR